MAILKKILLSVLVLGALSGCNSQNDNVHKVKGFILPHHSLVEPYIDEFYKRNADDSVDRVILFSPNHFGYGDRYIQTTSGPFLDIDLDENFIDFLLKGTSLNVEPRYFTKEHGVTLHIPYVKKYFPNAKFVPIIFKSGTPEDQLDLLINRFSELDLENTFLIGSIDFSHYVSESVALKNDRKIMDWLGDFEKKTLQNIFDEIKDLSFSFELENENSIAMDSPETFYVFGKLMRFLGAEDVSVWKRSSSASLTQLNDPTLNTSHIFAEFHLKKID